MYKKCDSAIGSRHVQLEDKLAGCESTRNLYFTCKLRLFQLAKLKAFINRFAVKTKQIKKRKTSAIT